MPVIVVTDSSSRLLPDELKQFDIRCVPLHVLVDGVDLRDGVDDVPYDIHDRPRVTTAGATPAALVVARGSVWVANSGDSTVSRFDPATLEEGPLRTISVGLRPTGIAYGAGAIWVANAGDGTVTRIEPSTYATNTIRVGGSPVAVAAGDEEPLPPRNGLRQRVVGAVLVEDGSAEHRRDRLAVRRIRELDRERALDVQALLHECPALVEVLPGREHALGVRGDREAADAECPGAVDRRVRDDVGRRGGRDGREGGGGEHGCGEESHGTLLSIAVSVIRRYDTDDG